MNRLLRTVYSVSYVYLPLTLIAVVVTGVDMPLLSYLCLLSGVLLTLLPAVFERLAEQTDGGVLIDPLNGQRAEAVALGDDAGAAEGDGIHSGRSFFKF